MSRHRFAVENSSLMRLHSYKTHTSKTRPAVALADGMCVRCEQQITTNTSICYDRKYGIFHARCYATFVPDAPVVSTSGVNEATVREMIDAAVRSMSGKGTGVDADALKKIAREVLSEMRTVELKVIQPSAKPVTIKNAHAKLKQMVYFVAKRQHVYAYGPPGSGKSTGARHAAESLRLKYGYISLNPQTPESRLLGFIDATGEYRETVFFQLYKNGGVFCIDEMDNASAALLTTLNTCLENGWAAFPCGMVKRHADFIVVATGNTTGRGGNKQFPERRAFDAAFAERFVYLEWLYDEAMERSVALLINPKSNPWVEWVQSVRKFAVANDPLLVVSPRASFKIAEFTTDNTLSREEIVEVSLFKGIERARVERILNTCPLPSAA